MIACNLLSQTFYNLPSGWSIQQNQTLDTNSIFNRGDSIAHQYILTYPTSNLPYFSQELYIKQSYRNIHSGDTLTSDVHFWVFFTPWNTVEIWDNYDYFVFKKFLN